MDTIDHMNGKISFAKEIKNLLEIARACAASDYDKEQYSILINHCENTIKTEEQFINIRLELMESECL